MKQMTPHRFVTSCQPAALRAQRSGAISIVLVVAVMVIGTLLLAESVRTVLNERHALPRQFERQQAEHILQSGVTRIRTLASFDKVEGGSWTFPKGILHPEQSGSLEIRVTDNKAIITARYPSESETPVSLSKTFSAKDWEQ